MPEKKFLFERQRKALRYYIDLRLALNPLVPPPRLMRVSPVSQYYLTGKDWASRIIEFGGLLPTDKVLDVGCGNGRVAMHLAEYLTGEYHGFDLRKDEIEWLSKNFTKKHNNFHFRHSNLYNPYYNKEGNVSPQEYTFPFDDNTFDFVYLTSVFTHLMPSSLGRYLSEVHRVLRPGGLLFASYFLINDVTRRLIGDGDSSRAFSIAIANGCYTDNADVPEEAIAYDEDYILEVYGDIFSITKPVHYGCWRSNRQLNSPIDYQDIVISSKI